MLYTFLHSVDLQVVFIAGTILLSVFAYEVWRGNEEPIELLKWLVLFVVSLLILTFGTILEKRQKTIAQFLFEKIGIHLTQVLTAVIVVAVGFGAHRFKQVNKLWYGRNEVLFGVISAVFVVSRIDFGAVEFKSLSLAQFGTLVGCAYVVARGLNNVSEAKAERLSLASTVPSTNP